MISFTWNITAMGGGHEDIKNVVFACITDAALGNWRIEKPRARLTGSLMRG